MLHTLNQFLVKINSLDGFLHWSTQRLSALTIIFAISISIAFDNLYFFLVFLILVVFHLSVGIRTLIDDYIHDDVCFLLSTTFLRIISIFLFKTIFILFIC
jgi:succinate dehydrogenase hydrophobic anchor subunit